MRKIKSLLFVIMCICIVCSCNLISAGSYPYAEVYRFKVSEDSLIRIVKALKLKDTPLVVPVDYGFTDGRRDSADYWYHIYFYDEMRNEIISTWIRQSIDTSYADFAFVGIKKVSDLGNWKYINKDFKKAENKNRKAEFKSRILGKMNLSFEEN